MDCVTSTKKATRMTKAKHNHQTQPSLNDVKNVTLTYLEFYSGVGGWSFALKEATDNVNKWLMTMKKEEDDDSGHNNDVDTPADSKECCEKISFSTQCLGAYDHSDLCYEVFHHNFPQMKQSLKQDSDGDDKKKNKRMKKKQKMTASSSDSPSVSLSSHSPSQQRPVAIEKLSKKYLEEKKADIWMMSPPCQPHTRQHSNQKEDVNDPRSKSFLHLCTVISEMEYQSLPKIILLENVIGFENSNSCMQWRRALFSRQYHVLHFHLNPPQVGLPNDRPRYYSIAFQRGGSNSNPKKNIHTFDHLFEYAKLDCENNLDQKPFVHTDIEFLGVQKESDAAQEEDKKLSSVLMPISFFLDHSRSNGDGSDDRDKQQEKDDKNGSFVFVSEKVLSRNASWCFDIVKPNDRRSACFTHSYGKFIRGTGSVLYIGNDSCDGKDDEEKNANSNSAVLEDFKLVSPEERLFDSNWNGMDLKDKLRYFTGTEMARLMGFPVEYTQNVRSTNSGIEDGAQGGQGEEIFLFSFPPSCTQKQCWKLMGNSLNVKVAGKVVELALRLANDLCCDI